MSFRKVDQLLWKSRTFRSMSEDARALYQYLLTSPHNNALCCYYLPDGYATADIQWDLPRFRAAMDELVSTRRPEDGTPMVVYDPANSLVLVWGQLEKEGLANPNAAKAALKALATMPRHSEIYAEVVAACERLRQPFCKQLTEALRERIPDPRARVQEQEQEQEQEINTLSDPPAAPRTARAPKAQDLKPDFEAFWTALPAESRLNVSKKKALESYQRARSKASHEQIMAGVQSMRHQWEHRVDGAFVPRPPMATTWLNQERWEADYSPPAPDGRGGGQARPRGGSSIYDQPMQLPNKRAFDGQ